ncbi:MAG: TSUP family transporter [Mesorhizobium sp.]|nr:TSUP family transporter [Mesorhizobium sp.]
MLSFLVPTLLSGGLVGFSLGLIGGGGSILATPLLLYVVGLSDPHIAIGTSALAGSSLGKLVDGERLLFLFGLLMIVVGAMTLRPGRKVASTERSANFELLTAGAAFVTGMASGFFGIGGGFLIVHAPILATGMPMINVIGSSLLAVGAFGLATALNYAASGLVDWPVAFEFIAGGILGGIFE